MIFYFSPKKLESVLWPIQLTFQRIPKAIPLGGKTAVTWSGSFIPICWRD